jgi:transposase
LCSRFPGSGSSMRAGQPSSWKAARMISWTGAGCRKRFTSRPCQRSSRSAAFHTGTGARTAGASQYNLPPLPRNLSAVANRAQIAERFGDPSVHKNVAVDLALADHLDEVIDDVEKSLVRTAKVDDAATYELLQTVPGIGKILGLVLLYEMHDFRRFGRAGRFLSYARLVRCDHESAGKKLGTGGAKIGNAYLKWAFAEAATGFLRFSERARRWKQKVAAKRGAGKAMAILAAKLGRAVFNMLRKKEAFDLDRFWSGASGAAATKKSAV